MPRNASSDRSPCGRRLGSATGGSGPISRPSRDDVRTAAPSRRAVDPAGGVAGFRFAAGFVGAGFALPFGFLVAVRFMGNGTAPPTNQLAELDCSRR